MTESQASVRIPELVTDGFAGRVTTAVEIVGETKDNYRIRAIEHIKLAGRSKWLRAGDTALVPKTAVRFLDWSPS